jgi:phosphoribosyl-AMP cyclohydrolase / phosphoribosyl-ATP pyrophosphohydrolase
VIDTATLQFDSQGLIPGIVQAPSGQVRMLGYLDRAALARTQETGLVTFFSRSRQRLWTKGEESGHVLKLIDLQADCDADALLITAEPVGPTCHTGTGSCFGDSATTVAAILGDLEAVLRARQAAAGPDGSYTERLFYAGVDRIAKKVVEEAGELVIAAKNLPGPPDAMVAFLGEAADLLFHFELLLLDRGVSLANVAETLRARRR